MVGILLNVLRPLDLSGPPHLGLHLWLPSYVGLHLWLPPHVGLLLICGHLGDLTSEDGLLLGLCIGVVHDRRSDGPDCRAILLIDDKVPLWGPVLGGGVMGCAGGRDGSKAVGFKAGTLIVELDPVEGSGIVVVGPGRGEGGNGGIALGNVGILVDLARVGRY